jgi:hypothetical protein
MRPRQRGLTLPSLFPFPGSPTPCDALGFPCPPAKHDPSSKNGTQLSLFTPGHWFPPDPFQSRSFLRTVLRDDSLFPRWALSSARFPLLLANQQNRPARHHRMETRQGNPSRVGRDPDRGLDDPRLPLESVGIPVRPGSKWGQYRIWFINCKLYSRPF